MNSFTPAEVATLRAELASTEPDLGDVIRDQARGGNRKQLEARERSIKTTLGKPGGPWTTSPRPKSSCRGSFALSRFRPSPPR
jgi:hypothetical protein